MRRCFKKFKQFLQFHTILNKLITFFQKNKIKLLIFTGASLVIYLLYILEKWLYNFVYYI